MNGPEEKFEVEELREELNSLRILLSVSLILLIVFGFCVDRYLFKQISLLGEQTKVPQQQVDKFATQYNLARASEFWNNLVVYSKSHPDFVPILAKYSAVVNQTLITGPAPTKPR